MRLPEFLRTTALRWTLVVAAAYVLGMALLAGFMYWETVDYLTRRDQADLRDEAQEATQGQPSDQLASVEEYLQDDAGQVKVGAIFDAHGRSLGGNLQALPAGLPPAGQLGEITLPRTAGLGLRRRRVRVLSVPLAGERLLVIGRGADSVHEINQIVTRALGLALLPLLAVALATGVLISRGALRRIAAVHGSSRLIMAGKLSERLPTRGTRDDFDQLARIVNAMLDEIERLMLETKGVGEDIAHDLRTPLTRLRVRVERAMSGQPPDSELAAMLAAAVQDIDQVLGTISAILRIAEIEHGQRRAGFRAIDLNEVLQEAVDLYEPIADEKRISLRVGGGRVDAVIGDPDLMFEALSNLLDNAVKFSPSAGTVSVLLQQAAQGPLIRVVDEGPGIPPEDWARVGRRFYRADRSRHAPGTGLGLSLVTAIVRLHGFAVLLDPGRPGCCIEIQCWPHAVDAGAQPPDRAAPGGVTPRGVVLACCALAWSLTLGACSVYAPRPLPEQADLAASATPSGAPPLDMNAVATLAVLNNPGLRAARARLHVADAQAFAAGLLPDPQVWWTSDHPTDHVTSSNDPRYPEYNAYGFGLSLDLQALLTHSSARASADAADQQARLDLLWQEWQTVAQARSLYVQREIAAEKRHFLAEAERAYALEWSHSQHALGTGDVALEQAGADLALLTDIRTQLGAADRNALQADQGLHALLGIRPDAAIPLQPLAAPELFDRGAVEAAAQRLPRSRPDLRALQAGYRSQEELVRKAVLSQFPNISVGLMHARDVANVHTYGFGVSMTLPLFDRGRGEIAITRATREQLRSEYQARLDQAQGEVWLLWDQLQQLQGELQDLERRLPRLQAGADSARRAYDAGDVSAASYLSLLNAYLAACATRFELTQSLWIDSVALATVLGTQVQPVSGP